MKIEKKDGVVTVKSDDGKTKVVFAGGVGNLHVGGVYDQPMHFGKGATDDEDGD